MPENNDIMVEVRDVSVVFNIANEKIQSLKEYFIKLIRRELMFREFVAVDDVSFEVRRGDVFGLVGTNGSGKSTMLKVIAGVLEPSRGTCKVHGSISPLIELGAGFDPELTARENIYLNGALLGHSKKFLDDHVDEIIDFAELHDFMEMPLKNYSSGMVARIAFAIATITEPDLLIVDEVLSVGDFLFQQKCEKRIRKMIEGGTTVLIVSHDTSQIERLCNRALWIEKSHLKMVGDAKDVCAHYRMFGRERMTEAEEAAIAESMAPGQKFTDVPPDAWYFDYVNEAVDRGFMMGFADTRTFEPDNVLKRGDMAVLLYQMGGNKIDSYESKSADKMYWDDAIAWCNERGILDTGSDVAFDPHDTLTREEFATVLRRYIANTGEVTAVADADALLSSFRDNASLDAWARDSVAWCVSRKIMQGKGDGDVLMPFDSITRAEAAKMAVTAQ